jgi:hypothetical protein
MEKKRQKRFSPSFANALPARPCTAAPRSLRSRKERALPGDRQVVSNGICVLAKNGLLDVVQNRGLEAFKDCPGREILLNAANAEPFRELGSYLRVQDRVATTSEDG